MCIRPGHVYRLTFGFSRRLEALQSCRYIRPCIFMEQQVDLGTCVKPMPNTIALTANWQCYPSAAQDKKQCVCSPGTEG